jgi:hypothetical protein
MKKLSLLSCLLGAVTGTTAAQSTESNKQSARTNTAPAKSAAAAEADAEPQAASVTTNRSTEA